MSIAAKHIVCLTLLLYLLSGIGLAFGAFWCLSDAECCGLGAAAVSHCVPHGNAAVIPDPSGSLLDVDRCAPCQDIELQFPPLKSRVRSLRIPVVQMPFLPALRSADAVLISDFPRLSSGLDEPRPLLAQRQLRTVVLLN